MEKSYEGICKSVTGVLDKSGCKDDRWEPSVSSKTFENVIIQYTQENMALVNIYINSPYAEEVVIDVEMSTATFYGNIGGILGAGIGFSLVTLAEIIWHCMMMCCQSPRNT